MGSVLDKNGAILIQKGGKENKFLNIYIMHKSVTQRVLNMKQRHAIRDPFYYHGLTLIHYKVGYEITYLFPNFNGCTVEVWERISNNLPHFTGHVITYPRWE